MYSKGPFIKHPKIPSTRPFDSAHQSDALDDHFMKQAIHLALAGETAGEVPIGALVTDENGQILATATNLREQINTVLGHAELIALHRACKKRKSWRLTGCTLYVTLEPCFMCAGALVQSRISRVVFGAYDPKGGALGSLTDLSIDQRLNHNFSVRGGVQAHECGLLLKEFFRKKRIKP